MVYGDGDWDLDSHGRQVADFRHNDREALESVVREAMEMSGTWQDIDEEHVRDEQNECVHGVYTGAGECCRCEMETILDDAVEIMSANLGAMVGVLNRHGSRFTGNSAYRTRRRAGSTTTFRPTRRTAGVRSACGTRTRPQRFAGLT